MRAGMITRGALAVLAALAGFWTFAPAVFAQGRTDVIVLIHTKHVDAWYGTVQTSSGPQHVLKLTAHLSQNGSDQIAATYADARVTDAIGAWVGTTNDIEWVLAPPEGLDAQQDLRDAFDALAAQPLSFDTAVFRGTETYYLTTWITTEQSTTEQSTTEPSTQGGTTITLHDGFLEVSYFELNATCCTHLAPALDRTGLLLLLMLLTVVAVHRTRERDPTDSRGEVGRAQSQ